MANYPGNPVRYVEMYRGQDEVGSIRIGDYGGGKYRVAAFLPDVEVFLPGDTPKVEPERCEWVEDRARADLVFDDLFRGAQADGWWTF